MSIIQLNNLNIHAEQNPIIHQFNAEINQGEFVAITGPSGSGKSTLLKYLAQLHDPTLEVSGQYIFKDQNIEDIPPVQLRQTISYCYQSPSLFGDTVRDNLAFPFEIRQQEFNQEKVYDLMESLKISQSFIDKPIRSLSGGEKQRIALIRNVIFEPEVLLLDEITSALDSKTRHILWQWLKSYTEEHQVTILMISHLEEEQELAQRSIHLEKIQSSHQHDDQENPSQEEDKIDQ